MSSAIILSSSVDSGAIGEGCRVRRLANVSCNSFSSIPTMLTAEFGLSFDAATCRRFDGEDSDSSSPVALR